MKKIFFIILILSLMLTYCSMGNDDQEDIELLINEYSDLLLAGYSSGEETETTKGEINTILWYRTGLDSVTFNADITFDGDTAIAEITVSLPGVLNLVYTEYDSITDSTDTLIFEKNFTDTLIRYARFIKDTVKDYHNGWRLDMVTSGEIASNTDGLVIDSVRFYIEGKMDTVISDIFGYFKRSNTMEFEPGEEVELTVYTPNTDNIFYVHSYMKRALFNVGDGVYTGTWNAASEPGLYRCTFDGMPNGLLTDDTVEYDNVAWFIPYIVE